MSDNVLAFSTYELNSKASNAYLDVQYHSNRSTFVDINKVTIPATWNNVQEGSDTFMVTNTTIGGSAQVTIATAFYAPIYMATLATRIQNGLNGSGIGAGWTVAYSAVDRAFTITEGGGVNDFSITASRPFLDLLGFPYIGPAGTPVVNEIAIPVGGVASTHAAIPIPFQGFCICDDTGSANKAVCQNGAGNYGYVKESLVFIPVPDFDYNSINGGTTVNFIPKNIVAISKFYTTKTLKLLAGPYSDGKWYEIVTGNGKVCIYFNEL